MKKWIAVLSCSLLSLSSFANVNKPEQSQQQKGQEQKERLRIDVLAPIYLDETVKGNSIVNNTIPPKAKAGLNFYEGVTLAAQVLNSQNKQIDIHVHDIFSAGKSPDALIKNGVLAQSDLIIGAFQGNDIKTVANFAQSKRINFVSVGSPSDAGVTQNPFFILLQPNLRTHLSFLNKKLKEKIGYNSVLTITNKSKNLDVLANKYFNQDKENVKSIDISSQLNRKSLEPYLDSSHVNSIAVTIMDKENVDKVLKFLATEMPDYRFDVYGMPSWNNNGDLKKNKSYNNLQIIYTAPFYYDVTTPAGAHLAAEYKKTFNLDIRPSNMVFRGYETIYWFGYLLDKYGPGFNRNLNDNAAAIFTRFELDNTYDDVGNLMYVENQNLSLYKYNQGNFTFEQ